MTVSFFRIISVVPAGTGKATVRYELNARAASNGGRTMMSGFLSEGVIFWMSATELAGRWYVNLNTGTFPGGSCS